MIIHPVSIRPLCCAIHKDVNKFADGLDLLNGEVRDNVSAGVLEPTVSKVKSLKSAFEAATSLLRIDDAIHCVPGTFVT